MLKKVHAKKNSTLLIHVVVYDVRELLKLESMLRDCGEFISRNYLHGYDDWGRNTVRSAAYTIKVSSRDDLRRLKIKLTKTFSDNSKLEIIF